MTDRVWGARRQCQFAHIKQGLIAQGMSESLAAELAARVVNHHRGQRAEAVIACAACISDLPAG